MIDFETFGNGKHACIVQIGACYFDIDGNITSTYKANVDAEDAMRFGAEMDASTVYWWLQQDPAAIASVVADPKIPEADMLFDLNQFLKGADEIWSHATFDFTLLCEALKRRHIKPAFKYRNARDIRTLTALAPKLDPIKRQGTHHDGLDDAVYQAICVAAMLRSLKGVIR